MGIISKFIKAIINSFNPLHYTQIENNHFRQSVKHLLFILFIAFIIASLAFLPRLIDLKDNVEYSLSKFETLQLSGNVSMYAPLRISEKNPQITIDTTGQIEELKSSKLLITKEAVYIRPFFKTIKIDTALFTDISANSEDSATIFTLLIIMILPSILLTLYLLALVKYMIIILIAGLVGFVILDLTVYRRKMTKMFNLATYAISPIALVEIALMPFNSNFLVPMFQFFWLNYYLISLLVFVVLYVIGIMFSHKDQ